MSDNIIMNDFQEFQTLFERYIIETEALKDVNCAQFYIFNMINSKIIFEYNYLEDRDVTVDELQEISNGAQKIHESGNIYFYLKKKTTN